MNMAIVALQRQWPFFLSLTVHAAVIGVGYGMLSRPAVFAMSPELGDGIVVDVTIELPSAPQQESGASLVLPEEIAPVPHVEPEPPVLKPEPEPEIALEKPNKITKVDKPKPVPVKRAPVAPAQSQSTTQGTASAEADSRASLGSASSPEKVGSGGSGIPGAEPDYLRNPPPVYPREARRAGEEGTVLLTAQVTSAGEVEDVVVKRSSSFGRLDQAALKSVRRWRFKPKQIAGISVSSTVDVPITFVLRG